MSTAAPDPDPVPVPAATSTSTSTSSVNVDVGVRVCHVYTQRVEFGDCDPAQIVWFPNFFRWVDAASRHFFVACGVPDWKTAERERGIIGTPLVDIQSRFIRPASYGDVLEIVTSISEWRSRSFSTRYEIRRGDTLLCEMKDVRVFARRKAGDDPHAIEAVPVPQDWKKLCGG